MSHFLPFGGEDLLELCVAVLACIRRVLFLHLVPLDGWLLLVLSRSVLFILPLHVSFSFWRWKLLLVSRCTVCFFSLFEALELLAYGLHLLDEEV